MSKYKSGLQLALVVIIIIAILIIIYSAWNLSILNRIDFSQNDVLPGNILKSEIDSLKIFHIVILVIASILILVAVWYLVTMSMQLQWPSSIRSNEKSTTTTEYLSSEPAPEYIHERERLVEHNT